MEFLLVSLAALIGTEPITLVKELMRQELAWVENPGGPGPFADEMLARLYTVELADAYRAVLARQAAINGPLLDGDPIIGAQDYCAPRGLTIDYAARGDDAATVAVRFRAQWCFGPPVPPEVLGAETEVLFDLVRVGEEWRVADFANSRYGSFRALLAQLMTQ